MAAPIAARLRRSTAKVAAVVRLKPKRFSRPKAR